MLKKYKAIAEYDGTGFAGWQRQKEKISIQEAIEDAIYKFSQQQVTIYGSGRTDAGVHALGQVFHFYLDTIHDCDKMQMAINFHLREYTIVILSIEEIEENFDARFSAVKRYYEYRIVNRKSRLIIDYNRAWHVYDSINLSDMLLAAKMLEGEHDFTSFRSKQCQAKNPIRTINYINIKKDHDRVTFEIAAKSFLHHMVRNIVGTLIDIAKGNIDKNDIIKILEARDRDAAGMIAPAYGLYLVKVDY